VLRSTCATNVFFVRAVLLETGGDTDAAVEYIIALSSDGQLDENFQNEFAYEHGIFPEGGFEGELPSSFAAGISGDSSAFHVPDIVYDEDFDPSLLKFAADVDAAEIERMIAEEEAAAKSRTSPSKSKASSSSSPSTSASSSSSSSSHAAASSSSSSNSTTTSASAPSSSASHTGHKHQKHADKDSMSPSPTSDSTKKTGKRGQKDDSSSSASSSAPHPKLERF